MSATLIVGYWVDWMQAGVGRFFGRADAAAQHSDGSEASFTTTGGVAGPKKSVAVPTLTEKVLWDYSDDPLSFEFMVVNSSVIGYLRLYYDKATSATDYTPLGTHQHVYSVGVGCYKPHTLTTMIGLTAATASDPSGWGTAASTLTAGRLYRISFYNPTADAAVVDFEAMT